MIIVSEATGKYKMALQVVAITMLILEGTALSDLGNLHLAGIVTLYLSLVLGYLSGGLYVWSFWKQVIAKGLWKMRIAWLPRRSLRHSSDFSDDGRRTPFCLLLVMLGYALGAIPFGIVVSKALNLPDPRAVGSKNVGFTNVLRVSGQRPGC